MMRCVKMLWCVLGCVTVAGCSESNAAVPDSGGQDAGDVLVTDADVDGGDVAALVINELRGQGDDFIEVVNPTTVAISLDGYSFTDADGIPDAADFDVLHQIPFPADLTIAPGEHFVIAMNVDAGSGTISTDPLACYGASRCFLYEFGLSRDTLDSGAILDGVGEVVIREDWPGETAAGVTSTDHSWCRLDDIVGTFVACSGTPGAVNAAVP